jgi:prepilin peptidase CpaA
MTPAAWIAIGLGLTAVVEDLARRRVPNWLTAGGVVAGLACAAWGGWHGLGMAAAGALVGFLILLPFHWCGAMGGGDVKLMAAYGALLGPSGILLAAVFTAVFGGLSAAGASLYNRRAPAVPYAPAIVLGAWISLLGGGS